MDNKGKKPGVAFCTAVAVILLLAYPLSFGPACWINQRTKAGGKIAWTAFYPMLWAANRSRVIDQGLVWYAGFGAPESVTPIFENGELVWEDVWETLQRMKKSARHKAANSRLAPSLSP